MQLTADGLTDDCSDGTFDIGIVLGPGSANFHIMSFPHDGLDHTSDWVADRLAEGLDWILERGGIPSAILTDNTAVMPRAVEILLVSLCCCSSRPVQA